MYAVIQLQGHQYIVQEGMVLMVDRMDAEVGKDVKIEDVLLTFDTAGQSVTVGKPHVAGAQVTLHIQEHTQGDKIHVIRFKNKSRNMKKKGFRPQQTVLTIKKIALNG